MNVIEEIYKLNQKELNYKNIETFAKKISKLPQDDIMKINDFHHSLNYNHKNMFNKFHESKCIHFTTILMYKPSLFEKLISENESYKDAFSQVNLLSDSDKYQNIQNVNFIDLNKIVKSIVKNKASFNINSIIANLDDISEINNFYNQTGINAISFILKLNDIDFINSKPHINDPEYLISEFKSDMTYLKKDVNYLIELVDFHISRNINFHNKTHEEINSQSLELNKDINFFKELIGEVSSYKIDEQITDKSHTLNFLKIDTDEIIRQGMLKNPEVKDIFEIFLTHSKINKSIDENMKKYYTTPQMNTGSFKL